MKDQMTSKEYQEFLKNKGPKKNKYNAKRTEYEGIMYDSKKEAYYAAQLDLRINAGEVESWERQHPIPLISNGQDVGVYKIDFKVILKDGSIEYHEVKGKETTTWKLKWKMAKAYMEINEPNSKLVLIK